MSPERYRVTVTIDHRHQDVDSWHRDLGLVREAADPAILIGEVANALVAVLDALLVGKPLAEKEQAH